MAKRRNKNKAKKRLAAIAKSKDMGVLCEEKVAEQDTENEENFENNETKEENFGLTENEGFTEKDVPFCEVTENEENIGGVKSKARGRKQNSKNTENDVDTAQKVSAAEVDAEETLIFPREIAGETCLDVECGNNDAVLYLTKLCLGSKGACILHHDKWYTPNEFQSVSGRETAKDWKRSIRHKGKSLKLLISKGLIEIQTTSPKKSAKKPESPKSTENATVCGDDASEVDGPPDEKATSPEQDNKSDTSEGPFKKNGKGRRGKKTKKQFKFKQNVALVRPLSIQKPIEEIPAQDLKDEKGFVEKPDVDKVEVQTDNAIGDETSPKQTEMDGETVSPMVDFKTESSIDNNSEKEEEKETEMDTRTDEERRLDEFVKSLRLTKTVNSTNGLVKTAPELTAVEDKKVDALPDEPIDTEMPVLQKEPIQEPVVHKIENLPSNVDPLQAAVTPPPTPPSENPVLRKVIEEDQEVETFKSRLSSPSDGLKLTINREKVKAPSESGEPVDESDVTPVALPPKDQNMQAFLLQDALQSAKKYKEQLQQNKQQFNSAPTSLPSKPVASVNSFVSMQPSRSPGLTKYSYDLSKPAIVNGAPKSQINNFMSKSQVPSKSGQGQVHHRTLSDHRLEKSRNVQGHHQSKTTQPTGNSGMPSVSDVMSMMPHLYGSLPFPLESQESALAALQAFHLKDKMSPFNSSQAAAQANLLNPVITQQLLMAMTQQLLHSSMYNIPQQQQQSQQHHRSRVNIGDKHHLLNSKSKEIRHHNSEARPEKTIDMSYKKRKHSEISNNADGVLDLSVKKPKLESVSASGLNKSHTSTDAPIDFSLKRKSEASEQKHTLCYKPHSGHDSVRSSFPNDYRYTQSSKSDDKRFPVGCTCKTGSAMDDISAWSVDRVCSFLTCLDGCAVYAKTFRDQGITGRLLPYLTTQHLTRTLGMKVGPALTLMHAVERKFREQMTKQTCAFCRNRQSRTVQI